MSKEDVNNRKTIEIVVSIDPGREKCGVAVVKYPSVVVHKTIVSTKDVIAVVQSLAVQHKTVKVILGNGTTSNELHNSLKEFFDVASVDEYRTTDMARVRYWQENPPRGWKKLLPVTMQVVPVPVDDYVAVILAEKYFSEQD